MLKAMTPITSESLPVRGLRSEVPPLGEVRAVGNMAHTIETRTAHQVLWTAETDCKH